MIAFFFSSAINYELMNGLTVEWVDGSLFGVLRRVATFVAGDRKGLCVRKRMGKRKENCYFVWVLAACCVWITNGVRFR